MFLILLFVSGARADDFRAVYAKVQSKLTQIGALEQQIHHLIEAKKHAPTQEQAKIYVDEMITAHGQMKTVFDEYQKELTRLRYQFPDQGEHFQRRYPRLTFQSLEEMELKHGLNADLDRIKYKMRQVYGVATNADKSKRKPASNFDWYEPPALIK